jgi:hypothetical protein
MNHGQLQALKSHEAIANVGVRSRIELTALRVSKKSFKAS